MEGRHERHDRRASEKKRLGGTIRAEAIKLLNETAVAAAAVDDVAIQIVWFVDDGKGRRKSGRGDLIYAETAFWRKIFFSFFFPARWMVVMDEPFALGCRGILRLGCTD